MRKIWRKDKSEKEKEKEKRRSFNGSNLYVANSSRDSNDLYSYRDSSFTGSNDMKDEATISQASVQDSNMTSYTHSTNATMTTAQTLPKSTSTVKPLTTSNTVTSLSKQPRSIHSLIKYDYDTKIIKNSWVNLIVNTSVNDVNDQTLRLFRAELRGSYLYLYKSNLHYRNFRLNNDNSKDDTHSLLNGSGQSVKNFDLDSVSISGPTISGTSISGPLSAPLLSNTALKPPEMFKNSNGSNGSIHSQPSPNISSLLTPNVIKNDINNDDDYSITYWETKCPHPDLKFNDESMVFQLGNSIEALVHFIFFENDDKYYGCVNQVLVDLPLLPNFGKTIRLINSMLVNLFNDSFTGEYHLLIILERILNLLTNVSDNFKGFLLKSDIAPYILKLLEIFNDSLSKEITENDENIQNPTTNGSVKVEGDFTNFLNDLKTFKSNMLLHQQNLINLMSNNNDQINDLNPFTDLNANHFLSNINLIEFSTIINNIDLMFFKEWNSNIDKSLLLYSTINSHSSSSQDFFYKKNPLFFNNEYHIHYLSRLFINHLFLENNLTSINCSASSLEFKARVLEKWIDLGCLLDKTGNMSSWLGIASVILSQPVLRLSKIWSFVSNDYIKLLKNDWSPVLFELERRFLINGITSSKPSSPRQQFEESGDKTVDLARDSYHIMAPRGLGKIYPKERVVPYFGDLIINNLTNDNLNELDYIYKKINYSFSRWNDYLKNLSNHNEIIKYNDDVLKRYDSMGFIFSNESLNQVLYHGTNSDDTKPLPQTFEMGKSSTLIATDWSSNALQSNDNTLKLQLLKLLELNSNSDSMNLEKLMLISLNFQPELPESYLKPLPYNQVQNSLIYKNAQSNHSNLSLNSNESEDTNNTVSSNIVNGLNISDPSTKLPTFNNHYFKLNLLKYDELYAEGSNEKLHSDRQNIKVSDDLIFRIDDFVTDLDNPLNSSFSALDEVDEHDDDDEVAGLGIDVDDILNSDKFNDFSLSNDGTNSDSATTSKTGTGGNSATNTNTNSNTNLSNINLLRSKYPSHPSHPTNSFSIVSSDSNQLHIYKYIPKYATIDKLIDLLIIDAKYLDESINIDLTEYRFVFLLNYNSYITTRELLDKLAHRFINSGNAVISIMKKLHMMKTGQMPDDRTKSDDHSFPDWQLDPSVDLSELGEVDYSVLLKIQINILKVLVLLINNFYSNFSMDLVNKKILIKLLKLFSNEILQWYNSNKIDSNLEKSFESLVNYYKKLKKLFVKKTYRPIEISRFNHFLLNDFKFSNSLHEVPMNRNLPGHKNIHKIEKFLHKFNKLLALFYRGIKIEDWIQIFKILEIEFEKNNLLEFNLQKNVMNDDNLIISNIFTYLDSLNDPQEKSLILKKFPLVFQKLFKLYSKFKTYILIQLTDLNITVDERLDRMKTLLYMLKICQIKMSNNQFVFEGKGPIPSCIESAITNVIYSTESRLFTNLWVKASVSLNESDSGSSNNNLVFDDINALLPKHLTNNDLAINHEFLLPCFGWIIENLLEINKIPNFNFTNFKHVINFNKKYLVFKILKELTIEDVDANEELNHNDTREFEFLLKLDENLVNNKNLKEFTLLEKDRLKLFKSIIREQHKILLIDNRKKQLKEGGSKELTSGNNSSQTSLSGSLNKKPSNSSIRRQSLSYKANSSSRFKISGFFNKSRPFSLGGSNATANSNQAYMASSIEKSISISELPNPDSFSDGKQRPSYVLSLKNKKIFPVYLMPLSFKIDSDNNKEDDYFFQCLDDTDLNDWLVKLNYANRHWFYSRGLNSAKLSVNTTFGIPISVVASRSNSLVPEFLVEIFKEIEHEGIKDVGIYRISTSITELNNLKSMIDRIGYIDFGERGYDTHALTSCVKSYFRELPEALLTDKVIEKCFVLRQDVINDQISSVDMILKFKKILKQLPNVHLETLKLLLSHLSKVCQFSDINKMTPANIATVIGPALTEASSLEILVNNFGFMNFILEKIIVNYNAIFDLSVDDVKSMHEQEDIKEQEVEPSSTTAKSTTHAAESVVEPINGDNSLKAQFSPVENSNQVPTEHLSPVQDQ